MLADCSLFVATWKHNCGHWYLQGIPHEWFDVGFFDGRQIKPQSDAMPNKKLRTPAKQVNVLF